MGTIQRFQKVCGSDSWFRELAYTARNFGSQEAVQRGYVSNVFETKEQVMAEALKIAQTIASKSPVAVNVTKKSILYSRDHSVAEGLDHIALTNSAMLQTTDIMASVTATMSKEKAQFAKL